MKMNFPSASQPNRQQVMLAGAAGVIVLAALGWFLFLRPAEGEPAADTVNVAARARAAREAAIARRKAAGDTAAVAQAGAKAPVTKKDSAAMKAAGPAGASKKDSAALAAKPGAAPAAPASPAARAAAKPDSAAKVAAAPGQAKDSAIVIAREDFAFEPEGRRDPFVSLMGSEDLRPAVSDLRVSGILWHPTRPVAVLRDDANKEQYRVTVGSVLGRMRVTQIKPKTVIFTIEEFGYNRRDSLILGDTTQVRAR